MDESNQAKHSKSEINLKDVNARNLKLAFQSIFNKLRSIVEQGFLSGVLLAVVISAAVYGYVTLTRSNITGIPFTVWQVSLIATAAILGLVVSIGLPILWGKQGGFKKVLAIIGWEFIIVAIALLVASFVLNSKNQSSNTGCTELTINNSSTGCIQPGGEIIPSQQ
jgi:amino acid permease